MGRRHGAGPRSPRRLAAAPGGANAREHHFGAGTFIPGVEPYDNDMLVQLLPDGERVRMLVEIEPHRDEHWTRQSALGFESQLSKVPAALAARRA
jgi:hypothetical protein